jgi:peroxiredoxin Q/BCP
MPALPRESGQNDRHGNREQQMALRVGDPAPDFELEADDGSRYRLSEHFGQRILLVFYPGDNTPVCTAQLCEYRDGIEQFRGLGVEVIGISKDGPESHRRFKASQDLPFTLLSDPALAAAKAYGAAGVMGMKRAVFLVDKAGRIAWQHVEALALFRRSREELITVIEALPASTAS